MAGKFSIATVYNGTHFRSRLEADWARTFDALGVAWKYETEAHYFGNVFYIPDFWLPKSRQFFEAKGSMENDDAIKIVACAFSTPGLMPVVVGEAQGHIYGVQRCGETLRVSRPVLMQCADCRVWSFGHRDFCEMCRSSNETSYHVATGVSAERVILESPLAAWDAGMFPGKSQPGDGWDMLEAVATDYNEVIAARKAQQVVPAPAVEEHPEPELAVCGGIALDPTASAPPVHIERIGETIARMFAGRR